MKNPIRPWLLWTSVLAAACSSAEVADLAPSAPLVTIAPAKPKTGESLKANVSILSLDPEGKPVTYTFAWLKNGERQAGLTTDTVPGEATKRGDVWTAVVTPNDGVQDGPAGQAQATVANAPPTLTLSFDPPAPVKGQALRVLPFVNDAEDDAVSLSFAWSRNGNATSFDTDTIPGDQILRGQSWQVVVTPNDGSDDGDRISASVRVVNAKPVAPGVTLSPEHPTKATPLVATALPGTDTDGDAVQLKFAWTVDGALVDGQSGASFEPAFFAKGQTVAVTVTPYDGTEDGPTATASRVIENSAPTAPVVLVTPALPTGADDITCSVIGVGTDRDGDPLTYLFAWTKNGQPFDGAVAQASSSTVPNALTSAGDLFVCTVAVSDGTAQTSGNSSSANVQQPPQSCAAILAANAAAADGLYDVDPDGTGPIAPVTLFCDMSNGGLTLVANLYDSAGDDAPNSTDYVVSGWQQTGNGTWDGAATHVTRDASGTGSAAVSLAFVAALKASAGQQNLRMCFVHQNGGDTVCRESSNGRLTLVSYPTGNPKLTVYSGNTLPYTYGRLAGLLGVQDGYDYSFPTTGSMPVPVVSNSEPEFGAGCSIGGLADSNADYSGVWRGAWHAFCGGISYRPSETDDNELGSGTLVTNLPELPNPSVTTYGFRLYVGP